MNIKFWNFALGGYFKVKPSEIENMGQYMHQKWKKNTNYIYFPDA